MSELFRNGKVEIGCDSKLHAITFKIEQDTLLVPPRVAEQYIERVKGRKFRVVRTPVEEMQCTVQGFLYAQGTVGDMYEWELMFPLVEIPHHVGLVEQALKRLYAGLN